MFFKNLCITYTIFYTNQPIFSDIINCGIHLFKRKNLKLFTKQGKKISLLLAFRKWKWRLQIGLTVFTTKSFNCTDKAMMKVIRPSEPRRVWSYVRPSASLLHLHPCTKSRYIFFLFSPTGFLLLNVKIRKLMMKNRTKENKYTTDKLIR